MEEQRDYGLVNHTFPATQLGMCGSPIHSSRVTCFGEKYIKGCHPCSRLLHRILLVISHIGRRYELIWLHLQLHLSICCAYCMSVWCSMKHSRIQKRECNVEFSRLCNKGLSHVVLLHDPYVCTWGGGCMFMCEGLHGNGEMFLSPSSNSDCVCTVVFAADQTHTYTEIKTSHNI